jgi:hypothetical protein
MKTIALASGFKLTTYALPPANFDIDRANDEDRAAYGFARLPRVGAPLDVWLGSTARRCWFVELGFPRAARRKSLPRLNVNHANATKSGTWSGGITFPSSGDRFQWVHGTWTMPTVAPPPAAQDGDKYCASAWVGIDGDVGIDSNGSPDVLQAGCDADVNLSNGITQHQYLPWWEWFPGDTCSITNISVSAGDVLDCLISVQAGSTAAASILLGNHTTNVALTFSIVAPAGTSLVGNCAEWIIEAFGSLGTLAPYGHVDFSDCNAGTVGGQTITAGQGAVINMVDATDQIVSAGTIINPTEVQVRYA